MIPFGSQRALGQDLATHLLNAHDNETLEVAQVRGSVARDLHGAFAEWEAVAHGLTRCRNYLYSLSINPDPAQGRLTREQYLDYVGRVEERLGLAGQPRAVIFHEKHGRQHCHVVWSRIDAEKGTARHLAFDHEKLMMVTREFARDHGLRLPDGYFRDRGDKQKGGQQSLYERAQEAATGLSKEERMLHVTQAWRASDSPKAFVRALEELGYVLATGKRPYVLVDVYGEVNALPKLIDDKTVRTKDIRAFLETEFPPESLPSVEEAQAMIAQHRRAIEDFNKAKAKTDELDKLKAQQAQRLRGVEKDAAELKVRQARERVELSAQQKQQRSALRAAYLDEMKRRKIERAQHRPTGLAAFLGRITGVALMTRKLHKYRDRKRFEAFLAERKQLLDRQGQERLALRRAQQVQAADVNRNLRALDQIEQRECRSLETAMLKQRRIEERRRHDHRMPPVKAKTDTPKKARRVTNPYTSTLARELAERAAARKSAAQAIDLKAEFSRAAAGPAAAGGEASKAPGSAEKERRLRRVTGRRVVTDVNLQGDFEHAAERGRVEGSGEADKAPNPHRTLADYRASKRRVITDVNLEGDFEHAATHRGNYGGEDSASSDGPKPPITPTPKPPRPRRPRGRNRDKDFDRDL
ncbi:MAG: relaxase/mobilization nuclease domain-containing protein [Rhodospirillales bacterium]|nr:relaxase/mobilization nuclease domain-containing protein [Rhodospirillales bacterium]